ncbi:MAG: helix-turn-helix transcriptional regulator [Aridibacter sp.]
MDELKTSDLINELEFRFRRIIREEIRLALLEPSKPNAETNDFQENRLEANKDFPTILTAPEIASLIEVSVPRIYELVRTRKTSRFPVIIIGERQYRFSKEAILEWIEKDNT